MTSHIHSNTQTEWRSPVPASKREEEYDYHHGLWYQQRRETHCFTCQRRRPEVVYTTRKPAKNNGDQRRECQICLCSWNQSYLYFWWISVSLKTMLIDISTSLLTILLIFLFGFRWPWVRKGSYCSQPPLHVWDEAGVWRDTDIQVSTQKSSTRHDTEWHLWHSWAGP